MEEKRTRRRRRKPMTPKNIKKHEDHQNEMALIAKEASEVLEPIIYNKSSIDRINAIPDVRTVMNPDAMDNLIGKYGTMTPKQLEEASRDPQTSCFERMMMERQAMATSPKTKAELAISESIINRIGGKAKERHEHSGPNGGPLVLATSQAAQAAEWETIVENMTAEEFEEYKNAVEFNSRMKNKYANNK